MVVIRLTRVGKKNSPSYRVVVADKRRAVKRKFIEIIGHYNPTMNPREVVISKERALFWIKNGAQASDTVRNLMVDLDILPKSEKVKKIYGKEMTKKAKKDQAEGKTETMKAVVETTEEKVEEPAPDEKESSDAKQEQSESKAVADKAETTLPEEEPKVEEASEKATE